MRTTTTTNGPNYCQFGTGSEVEAPVRRSLLSFFFLLFVVSMAAAWLGLWGFLWPGISAVFLLIALYDVIQRKHTLYRNFPVLAHLRFLLEMVRPEIQQYFIESDTSEDPISRIYRNLVYEKAKGELETVPFGSELNLYADDYRWLNHSIYPVDLKTREFRVKIGNEQCLQPYSASLFNISAMSFGSISKEAIRALGGGAKAGGFYMNTGEGGLSPYHLESGCDLVWQLGTAYFGARDERGYFDPQLFKENAAHEQVRMIEIKISQGAKPGHGGILPGVKVDAEIASIRRVPEKKTVISPPGHTAFTNADELCEFIARLRELSGGKPIGFKFCLGRREEFIHFCEASLKHKIYPDFITVDGGEGGTGAAPFDFINYVGSPLSEALYFVNMTLQRYGLRKHIRLIASGKVISAFNIFEKLALGADLCNSARGMLFALGCIQAYRCNTNKCPTGIATNNSRLSSGLDVPDKAARVERYHCSTLESFADLLSATGLKNPSEIKLIHVSSRYKNRIVTLEELFAKTSALSPHEKVEKDIPSQGEPRPPVPPV